MLGRTDAMGYAGTTKLVFQSRKPTVEVIGAEKGVHVTQCILSDTNVQSRSSAPLPRSHHLPATHDRNQRRVRRTQPGDGHLSLLEVLSADATAARTAELSRVIGSYSGEGNLVLVTHEPNINAVSFEMVQPADFLVLQPKGGSAFEELGIVKSAATD